MPCLTARTSTSTASNDKRWAGKQPHATTQRCSYTPISNNDNINQSAGRARNTQQRRTLQYDIISPRASPNGSAPQHRKLNVRTPNAKRCEAGTKPSYDVMTKSCANSSDTEMAGTIAQARHCKGLRPNHCESKTTLPRSTCSSHRITWQQRLCTVLVRCVALALLLSSDLRLEH